MKKRIVLPMLLIVCALCLSACGCEHEIWQDADCVTAKTCAECGETEGEPLGHDWAEGDCLNPKTCSRCADVEGEALGHDWIAADCENPEICSRCAATQGEVLGHRWLEATTEAPETCEGCGLTQGSRIITDRRFKTENCRQVFGIWEAQVKLTGEMVSPELAKYVDAIDVLYQFELRNDGDAIMTVKAVDEEKMAAILTAVSVDAMYAEFEKAGISRQDANKAMLAQYGMTLEKLIETQVASMDLNELFSSMCKVYVYYIDGDQFYLGDDWDDMEGKPFTLEGDTLTLPVDDYGDVTFSRIVEEDAKPAA